jgi:hypothetical protein
MKDIRKTSLYYVLSSYKQWIKRNIICLTAMKINECKVNGSIKKIKGNKLTSVFFCCCFFFLEIFDIFKADPNNGQLSMKLNTCNSEKNIKTTVSIIKWINKYS